MKMTTKGRYAVTAMLDLAIRGDAQPIPLAEIAGRQCLSLSYLEQLFSLLRRADLVKSTRGPGGGYTLGAPPQEIPVSAIIRAVNEVLPQTGDSFGPCYLSQIWDELSNEIELFLDSISLADVLESKEVKNIADRQQQVFIDKQAPGAIGE